MKTAKYLFPLLFALASCATPAPKFHDMTAAEIMAYNRTVEYLDQVQCTERVGTGSHIRRTECNTIRDILQGQIGSLDTPSSSTSIVR